MRDRDIVVRVATSWRRAVVSIRPRRLGYRTSYATTIKGRPAIRLMLELAPFMSGVRRRAIRRAIRQIGPAMLPRPSWSPSLPWLAGLLEGEGTFTARRNGSWVGISVEMSDRATVHRAASMLGASRIYRDAGSPELGWRPTFVTHISGNRAPAMAARATPVDGRAARSGHRSGLGFVDADQVVACAGQLHRSGVRQAPSRTWPLQRPLHALVSRSAYREGSGLPGAPLTGAVRKAPAFFPRLPPVEGCRRTSPDGASVGLAIHRLEATV